MHSEPPLPVIMKLDRLTLLKGDISAVSADAIVNAASHFLLDAGGVSSAILRAAGPELRKKCLALRGCDEGQAKITDAFALSARHILHTVAPVWREGSDGEAQRLVQCYRSCFDLIEEYGHRTVAFPSLGTGGHGYPIEAASRIALNEMTKFLQRNRAIAEMMIVCFDDETCDAYLTAARDLDIAKGLVPTEQIEVGSTCVELVALPAGDFEMGSANRLFGEAPIHEVRIPRPFLLSRFPITQATWTAVVGGNPATFRQSEQHPVESVDWNEAVRFCEKLSTMCRRQVRLPSEAEWEYACRAGTETEFFMCADLPTVADASEIPTSVSLRICHFAWFDLNAGDSTHPVGTKLPNPWGLHDLIGNVWEWCQDGWHNGYAGAPRDGRYWPPSREMPEGRCLRGGAWDMDAFRCRSTYRSWDDSSMSTDRIGLRVVVEA